MEREKSDKKTDEEIAALRDLVINVRTETETIRGFVQSLIPEDGHSILGDKADAFPNEPANDSWAEVVRKGKKIRLVTTQTCSDLIAGELEDRDDRRRNLVLYNVPESKENTREGRRVEEKIRWSEICEKLGRETPKPRDLFRLGKFDENHTRSRPLLVKLDDETTREDILRVAFKCKNFLFEGEERQVAISRDRTRMEREKEKEKRSRSEKSKKVSTQNQEQKIDDLTSQSSSTK